MNQPFPSCLSETVTGLVVIRLSAIVLVGLILLALPVRPNARPTACAAPLAMHTAHSEPTAVDAAVRDMGLHD